MITIATQITEEEDGACVIGFSARDQDGCTKLEGDVADTFRKALIRTRDKVINQYGFETKTTLANIYQRKFDDPKDRDSHSEGELKEEWKKRTDALIEADDEMLSRIFQTAFIAGMQLSMRLCRNRAEDCKAIGKDDGEAQNCAGIIRLCQVEIGSGRMQRPKFTKEELEEMDRIS